MPDLFLITSEENAVILRRNIESIGNLLAMATVFNLTDLGGNPKKVAVYIIAHQGGYNVPALQILGIASWKRSRVKQLEPWKMALAGAWTIIMDRILNEYANTFPTEEVEVYPIMPRGSWGIVKSIVHP